MAVGALADHLDALARRGLAGLAWEVLRRDPAYRAAFASAGHAGACAGDARLGAGSRAWAADWGLHFR
jgi:hypothetical protein